MISIPRPIYPLLKDVFPFKFNDFHEFAEFVLVNLV